MKHNGQITKQLQERIIRKFQKRTAYSRYRDNIWGADLADMKLISKFDKEFRFLFCIIDFFS